MDGVEAAESMSLCKIAGVMSDVASEFHDVDLLKLHSQLPLRALEGGWRESPVASRGRQRGANLRFRDATYPHALGRAPKRKGRLVVRLVLEQHPYNSRGIEIRDQSRSSSPLAHRRYFPKSPWKGIRGSSDAGVLGREGGVMTPSATS